MSRMVCVEDEDWETEEASPVDFDLNAAWTAAILWAAVDKLEPKDRKLIRLRYRDGRSLKVIAKRLGISRSAVEKRLARALADLRQYLGRRLYGR